MTNGEGVVLLLVIAILSGQFGLVTYYSGPLAALAVVGATLLGSFLGMAIGRGLLR